MENAENTEKIVRALYGIVDEVRGVRGAINAGIASQAMTHEMLVKMARLEERMDQTNRSLGTLQKTLLGLAVSVILTLVSVVIKVVVTP